MAKKSLIAKANRKPKFSSRAYTRCRRCGRPRAYLRKFHLCRICFRELALAGQLWGEHSFNFARFDERQDGAPRKHRRRAIGSGLLALPIVNCRFPIAEK